MHGACKTVVGKKSQIITTTKARHNRGDWETCTTQTTTSDRQNDLLPINRDDAAVTVEKRTAAMERWLLFSWVAGSSHNFLWTLCESLAHHCAHHLRICTSSEEAIQVESGRRAPEIKYVQLYTTHTRECWFKTAELLPGQHDPHNKQHNTTSRHQQPWPIPIMWQWCLTTYEARMPESKQMKSIVMRNKNKDGCRKICLWSEYYISIAITGSETLKHLIWSKLNQIGCTYFWPLSKVGQGDTTWLVNNNQVRCLVNMAVYTVTTKHMQTALR